MVEGATYAIFSPVWGILFDRGWNPHLMLLIGCVGVILAFFLLGPANILLPFLPNNIIVISIGLIIEGSCVAATYITTLVFMINESIGEKHA